MRFVYQSVTGVGTSEPVPLDVLLNPFTVSIGVALDGAATFTVEHTFDDIWAPGFVPGSAHWIAHPTLADQTQSTDGNYAFPVRAVRLRITAGAGTATMAVGQAGLM